jgi:septum site-determining protein MinC
MNSDSATPNLESNSAFPDAEVDSQPVDLEENGSVIGEITTEGAAIESDPSPIIPNAELNSVLRYLKVNSEAEDVKPDISNTESKSELESTSVTNTESKPELELQDANNTELEFPESTINPQVQVQLRTQEGKLCLILPTEAQLAPSDFSWGEMWQQMKQRLNAGSRLRTPNTPLHLVAKDRLLDVRQLQELAETLNEYQLQLKSVATSRRQTAIAAVSAGYSVEQLQAQTAFTSETTNTSTPQADALYLEMTVRSGVEIRHPGTVIILGDINPGGIVVADGDIIIWGRLRGVAHAGAKGNRESLIMALQMEPTQLRIADAVARAPEKLPSQFFAEVAHITPQGIRIAKATDFSRSQLSKINQEL